MIEYANGQKHSTAVRKESDGTWSRNVWFGAKYPTTVRRYYYSTRRAATVADISDEIGKRGRIR